VKNRFWLSENRLTVDNVKIGAKSTRIDMNDSGMY
jgi:hypothetical protein